MCRHHLSHIACNLTLSKLTKITFISHPTHHINIYDFRKIHNALNLEFRDFTPITLLSSLTLGRGK